jgi:hypothetical protein
VPRTPPALPSNLTLSSSLFHPLGENGPCGKLVGASAAPPLLLLCLWCISWLSLFCLPPRPSPSSRPSYDTVRTIRPAYTRQSLSSLPRLALDFLETLPIFFVSFATFVVNSPLLRALFTLFTLIVHSCPPSTKKRPGPFSSRVLQPFSSLPEQRRTKNEQLLLSPRPEADHANRRKKCT